MNLINLFQFHTRSPEEVILHKKCERLWSNLCDDNSFVLSSRKLKNYILVLLWKAAFELDKQEYPNIHFNLCRYNMEPNCFLKNTKVGINLTVCWNGEIYKNLKISIDLTPGVPVPISEGQMKDLNEYGIKKLSDKCIHVVPYVTVEPYPSWPEKSWRPSFSLVEVQIMKTLTRKQISVYKCLKFLRDLHSNVLVPIPSYHLKTFLLSIFLEDSNSENLELEDFHSSVSRAILLLKQLLKWPVRMRTIPHLFLNFPLDVFDYDLRWCKTILKHVQAS